MPRPHRLWILSLTAALTVPAGAQQTTDIEGSVAAMTRKVSVAELRRTVQDLVGFHTRHVASVTDVADRGTGAARRYLEERLRAFVPGSGGRLSVARDEHTTMARRLRKEVHLVNIVATLRGTTDPERVYVVGGHYDSINGRNTDAEGQAPGANDDGSGTAAVIEMCRVMSGTEFPATILFVCYDGEEMGLLGSAGHAARLAEAGTRIDGMITNDIVGNTLGMDGVRRTDYLRCFSYAPRGNDSPGRSLARAVRHAARRHLGDPVVRLVFRGDRYGRGGDHRSFFSQGYPAVRLTEPREDYSRQHQNVTERDGRPYGDLPEFMDFDYLADVTRINVAALAELASAPPPPDRVRVRGARDAYDVQVNFTPVEGAADHEVLWRLTTSPDWEHATLVGDDAREARGGVVLTLKGVCLDDVVIGVRAVGADGSRSRVTTPPEPDAYYMRPAGGQKKGR